MVPNLWEKINLVPLLGSINYTPSHVSSYQTAMCPKKNNKKKLNLENKKMKNSRGGRPPH